MSDHDVSDRQALTFEQAEGIDPLPSQFARGQISNQFRAALWQLLKREFERQFERSAFGGGFLARPWSTILEDAHVYRYHRLDEFPADYQKAVASVKTIIERGSWSDVLGWLEFVLKHPSCPRHIAQSVNALMTYSRLAYRVVDGRVICPVGSEAERGTIQRAFADLKATEFNGARAHLRKAASELTAGNYADSVRESIHAVEGYGPRT
jgi:hypothetical protein